MTVSSVAVTRTELQDFLTSEIGGPNRWADVCEYGADVEKAIREAVEATKARYRLTFAAPLRSAKYHIWRSDGGRGLPPVFMRLDRL